LKTRNDAEERELTLARAKLGELMMHLELSRAPANGPAPPGRGLLLQELE